MVNRECTYDDIILVQRNDGNVMMKSRYVDWLKRQGVPLFKAGGIYWRLYQKALVPAPYIPCFVDELSNKDAKVLLVESRALFLRYSSDPCEELTDWWYILCDSYNPGKISSKTRYNINRGNRNCTIQKISAEWLADNGYECYLAAHTRYKNLTPISKNVFCNNIIKTAEGPFENWGVFVKDKLAGYCQCIIDGNYVATNVSKYHPGYLKQRSSYALIHSLINHYVVEHEMTIISGNRSVSHETNYQDFLIKLGYRKQFCHLNIFYKSWLKYAIQSLYPLRTLIANLPNSGITHMVQSMLFQEELQRAHKN